MAIETLTKKAKIYFQNWEDKKKFDDFINSSDTFWASFYMFFVDKTDNTVSTPVESTTVERKFVDGLSAQQWIDFVKDYAQDVNVSLAKSEIEDLE